MKKVFCFLTITLLSVLLTACGGSKLAPITKEIELGSDVSLVDLVKYNTKKIAIVLPADGAFIDTNTLGTYDVTYSVFSSKGKESTQTISFSVVDTTAPEITNESDSIYLIKGAEFIPEELIAASDLGGEVSLSYTGELDSTTVGEFPITICATDASGNIAEKDVTVIIEDRTPDFRNAMFGDSKEVVMRYETAEFVYEYEGDAFTAIEYSTSINDTDMSLYYYFNNSGELYLTCYALYDDSFSSMKADYDEFKTMLNQKYGEGQETGGVLSRLYKYCSSDDYAFKLGYIGFQCDWSTEKMSIRLELYDGKLTIRYESTEYAKTPNSSGL